MKKTIVVLNPFLINLFTISFLIVLTSFCSSEVLAEESAYIDVRFALNNCFAGIQAKNELEALIKEKQKILDVEKSTLKKMESEINYNASELSRSQKKKLKRAFQERLKVYNETLDSAKNYVNELEAIITRFIINRIKHTARFYFNKYQHIYEFVPEGKEFYEIPLTEFNYKSKKANVNILNIVDITKQVIQHLDQDAALNSAIDKYFSKLKLSETPPDIIEDIYSQQKSFNSSTPYKSQQRNIINEEDNVNDPVTTGIRKDSAVAVVVGNKEYIDKDIQLVDYAINDAMAIKSYLIKAFGYNEINIIYVENATKANFDSIFGTYRNHRGRLYDYLKKGESDAFIYYSGHGAPDIQKREGYLLPVDADLRSIALTGYPLDLLYNNVAKINEEKKLKNVYILIDACFSGSSHSGSLLKDSSPVTIEIQNPFMKQKNVALLTSSSGSEISSWYPEKQHSMFTYFFLKSLKEFLLSSNKPTLTIGNIFTSLIDENKGIPYFASRLYGRTQTPQLLGNDDLILLSGINIRQSGRGSRSTESAQKDTRESLPESSRSLLDKVR